MGPFPHPFLGNLHENPGQCCTEVPAPTPDAELAFALSTFGWSSVVTALMSSWMLWKGGSLFPSVIIYHMPPKAMWLTCFDTLSHCILVVPDEVLHTSKMQLREGGLPARHSSSLLEPWVQTKVCLILKLPVALCFCWEDDRDRTWL